MDGAQRKGNWSLKELETLLQQKRHALSERRASSFLSAEVDLRRRLMSRAQEDAHLTRPPKSPESWSGANGQDRYFRSMTVVPLDGSQHWLLPDGRPAQEALGATVTIRSNGHSRGQRWRDALLLVIEIVAVVGLLAAVGLTYLHLRPLNEGTQAIVPAVATPALVSTPTLMSVVEVLPTTSALIQVPPTEALPTVPPTPMVMAELTPTWTPVLVLPGGRPATRGMAPGTAELPTATTAPLQAVLATLEAGGGTATVVATGEAIAAVAPTNTAILQTPGPRVARRLVIPKIGVDAPVVEGDTWEDLKKGIGHHPGSANPGETGNMVVSAHIVVHCVIFRHLDELEPGDEVFVSTDDTIYQYIVTQVHTVLPTRVEFMEPTTYPALTMITCYPYLIDTHRIVVVADLAGTVDSIQ